MLVGLALVRPVPRRPSAAAAGAAAAPAGATSPEGARGSAGSTTTVASVPTAIRERLEEEEEEGVVESEPPFMVVATPEYEYECERDYEHGDADEEEGLDPAHASGVTIKAGRRTGTGTGPLPRGSEADGADPRRSDTDATEETPLLRAHQPPPPRAGAGVAEERNITGWALLRELDFYLLFLFNGLCAGVGLCCESHKTSGSLPPPPFSPARLGSG